MGPQQAPGDDRPPPQLAGLLAAPDAPAREKAWGHFVETYSRLILHVARRVDSRYDAAMDYYAFVLDRLQEAEFRRLRGYQAEPQCKFTTWLTVVARRLCIDRHRQRYGRIQEGGESSRQTPDPSRRNLLHLVAERLDPDELVDTEEGTKPDSALRRRELTDALRAELESLPASNRHLLALRFEDDLGAREIADILGLPTPFHVYRAVNRVLLQLRGRLKRRGVEGPTP